MHDKAYRPDAGPAGARPRARTALRLAPYVLIPLAALAAIQLTRAPRAVPADAPAGEFSSGRSMRTVRLISQAPHPIGSRRAEEVRAQLLAELTALGLSPEVQEATGLNTVRRNVFFAGTVRNILARLPGTDSRRAVLLLAHYDTVPGSTGANDDGS